MEPQHNGTHQNEVDFSTEDIESFLGVVLTQRQDEEPNNSGSNSAIPLADQEAARTQRKRSREKQRRSDVNKQFTELTQALRKIESESEDCPHKLHSSSTTNRADLVAHTISLLNSLHESNENRKRKVSALEKELDDAKKSVEETTAKLKDQMMSPHPMNGGKVMMMVPMMIGGDSAPIPYGHHFFPQGNSANPADASASNQAPRVMPMAGPPPQWGQMMPQAWGMPPSGWGVIPAVPTGQQQEEKKKPAQNTQEVGGNLAHCA